jgi:transcriptional regulator with XRE-family HTH domain
MGELSMTETKQFLVGGKAISDAPHHYRSCGLDDVYLLNGFEVEQTEDADVVTIHNIDGLHEAIAMTIVTLQRPLRPRELRFLRKTMEQTQDELAKQLGVNVQTVARYEKDEVSIPPSTDLMVRVGFLLHKLPDEVRAEILEEVYASVSKAASAGDDRPLRFRQSKGKWGDVSELGA